MLLELFVTLGHLGPDPLQALGRVKKREGGLRDVPDPARLRHLNSLVQPEPVPDPARLRQLNSLVQPEPVTPEPEQPSSAPVKTFEAKNVIPFNVS